MPYRRTHMRWLAILLVCVACVTTVVDAAEDESLQDGALHDRDVSSGVPRPAIPLGQGEGCVEDIDFMRRNHMDLLKHQRNDTMLKGLRSEPYSLKECVSCHAVYGPDEVALTVASPKHFCRSCHDYAAVSIDCFQCHASRPESDDPDSVHPFQIASPNTTAAYGSQQP